ncbi:MAG TPA: hypothetical protein VF482_03680 [Trebonia sp.]
MADRKIYFATDIHGSEVCLRKFLNAAKFYGCDTLIMGGDITGKMIVPRVRDTCAGVPHLGWLSWESGC